MRTYEDGREFAQKKDAADGLKKFQERFYKQEGIIYMDGNSLGLCSKDAEASLMEALDAWKKAGIDAAHTDVLSAGITQRQGMAIWT